MGYNDEEYRSPRASKQYTSPKNKRKRKTKGQQLEESGEYLQDPETQDTSKPLESRMFDIDPKKHKTQQKQVKIRNIAEQGSTEGERAAGQGKLKDKTIISLTRIEPPLHPDGPEKMLMDFGVEPEEFKEDELLTWFEKVRLQQLTKITEGIFAPWAFYKKDFQEIGGHDPLYAPQSKEDSDIFNRFQLNGIRFIQTWGGCVYHMTCRGSRRNTLDKAKNIYEDSPEWLAQNERSARNFIRKWGSFVKHNDFMKPVIPLKYDIGIILSQNNINLLRELEPWCNNIYCDSNLRQHYITTEQSNTIMDLSERVLPYNNEKNNEILVTIGDKFNNEDYRHLQQLSQILTNDKELHEEELPCEFVLENLSIEIFQLNTYEKELIKL